MLRRFFPLLSIAAVLALSGGSLANAESHIRKTGTITISSGHDYRTLISRLDSAVTANKMGLVTRASATLGAQKALKMTIPGNMVVGVYHPSYAVRMLKANVAAGIEAPLRFYITENDDKTATLSYRKPSSTFAPYQCEELNRMAGELDTIFAKIAQGATGE